jgi:F-type H+-transporting ATPase subunit a
MDIKDLLEEFRVVFSIPLPGGRSFAVNETLLVSWLVMALLIVAARLLTRNLREIPKGPQVLLEWAVEFLNNFSREHFGRRAGVYGPYIGTVFLFLLGANIIPAFSPMALSAFGIEPPFVIKPPARDINLTAALAVVSILLTLIGGLRARGFGGWCKNLLKPAPMMLPFNLLEYVMRPASLCLRLFGNILGGFIIMLLIEYALPVPLIAPVAASLYFDFIDGIIQAVVFTFLTTLFISEAVGAEEEA